jgi:post-segregation antitoxin (ccd killing protein)
VTDPSRSYPSVSGYLAEVLYRGYSGIQGDRAENFLSVAVVEPALNDAHSRSALVTPEVQPSSWCVYSVCMPRINVYLSDEMAAAVRPLGLNLSQVLQAALKEQLQSGRLDAWLGQLEEPHELFGSRSAIRNALEVIEGEQHRG